MLDFPRHAKGRKVEGSRRGASQLPNRRRWEVAYVAHCKDKTLGVFLFLKTIIGRRLGADATGTASLEEEGASRIGLFVAELTVAVTCFEHYYVRRSEGLRNRFSRNLIFTRPTHRSAWVLSHRQRHLISRSRRQGAGHRTDDEGAESANPDFLYDNNTSHDV